MNWDVVIAGLSLAVVGLFVALVAEVCYMTWTWRRK